MNERTCTCDWTLDLTENPCPTHGTERCLREVNGPTIEQMIEEMGSLAVAKAVGVWRAQSDAVLGSVEAGSPFAAVRALFEKWKAQ